MLEMSIKKGRGLSNLLEPESLVDSFLSHPPVQFRALELKADHTLFPAFFADFDLLTTLDGDKSKVEALLKKLGLRGLTVQPTLFVGTTVTEYANYPGVEQHKAVIDSVIRSRKTLRWQLAIIKDIPSCSPLISAAENEAAESLLEQCKQSGQFIIVSGQALAYVPIDFASIDEYLMRMSKVRRKDLRKKLKARDGLTVERIQTGDAQFKDESFLDEIYSLYLNVYEQSIYHFDLLTKEFFRDLLCDADSGGIVFVYRKNAKMIGYNICFVHDGNLIDKYVGFAYPEAQEANLYFVSWFENLAYAHEKGLRFYIAGWTDPEVKSYLGAKFTMTQHAVHIHNPLLRMILKPLQRYFEPDKNWSESETETEIKKG